MFLRDVMWFVWLYFVPAATRGHCRSLRDNETEMSLEAYSL